ncbi:nucleotidyltransferase domain-containing protein [Spirosoma sp. BT702]|uniref:Nucleotidyltransferase domain-containing protein n=1 Tax=Spirosoma profusum TaxID=2771354 RepID=A0A927ATV9_9BACT|nr:nucleotidyltransferase domain-containing protein [Spirosoma profusum]MBD2701232.1 nucleotidyltransferase domain-containing protein [Spirosoma profusum]
MKLPEEKKKLLDNIIYDLKEIDNVKAVVLGGSYAVGTATATSDLDIGIYYSNAAPFSIESVKSIAQKYAVEKPTVTGFYEWGPWVNGGAWIKTNHGEVDFLYKNIEQITSTIENAKNGVWENHFEQQPPYGFSSIIFLAETQSCISLYDPDSVIGKLKKAILIYPEKLKKSVVQQSLWSAEFTIWQADNFAKKQDVYNTIGCLTRAVKSIVTALFSINELYPMGDKRAIDILEKSNQIPEKFREKIDTILCADKYALTNNVTRLKSLFSEAVNLATDMYKPYYDL